MISDKTIDEALIEIMRTKKALEALRKARKGKTTRCWNSSCDAFQKDQPLAVHKCQLCGELAYEHGSEAVAHAAAERASMDLTRKLADLRAGR
jgi:hypothetical protein